MAEKRKANTVPAYKKKFVNELTNMIKSNKTLLVASVKNLPASQFQQIGKKLRGKAVIKVPKKSFIFRAIDNSKNTELEKLKNLIDENFAILFSNVDAYDLAGDLLNNKTAAKAKTGQIAPMDIEIPAGPTELTPGPAISEMGALGIKIQIKGGKIEIASPKIIAKKGDSITEGACSMMGKLDIKPFSIGYIPLAAFDLEKNILYDKIEINTEATIEALKEAYSKALPFAVNVGYACSESIKFMITKAAIYEKALQKLESNTPKEKNEEISQEVSQ
jgi:large subunit ribosomal protein L10